MNVWATAGQYALRFSFPFLSYSPLAGYIINLKLILIKINLILKMNIKYNIFILVYMCMTEYKCTYSCAHLYMLNQLCASSHQS